MTILAITTYKLDNEIKNYSITIDEINNLNDTYYICLGLMKINPSLDRIKDCEYIKTKLDLKIDSLENDFILINIYKQNFVKLNQENN